MVWNKYPYTDYHALNLDYILAEIKRLDDTIKDLDESILTKANAYTDEQITSRLSDVERQYAEFKATVEQLIANLDAKYDTFTQEMRNDFDLFKTLVNARLTFTDNHIAELESKIDNFVVVANAYTDVKVEQNNDRIIEQLEQFLGNIHVINLFTGERVTVQDMFNYLANLHTDDAITYEELAERDRTVSEIIALDKTYTELAISGNIIII